MKSLPSLLYVFLLSCLFLACSDSEDTIPEPEKLTATDFVSGLKSPIGMSIDGQGQLWVTEAGTGKADASVSLITAAGVKTTLLSGLPSEVSNGAVEGISHLLHRDGKLYILHGVSGMLYIVDVSKFKSGDAPLKFSDLTGEDIGTYVKSLALTNPLNSNPYDLTFGPDGHLYIADAGANAIIKRDKDTRALSKFAEIPGPATGVESVPTGIVYNGTHFLVTSLTGFPFAAASAKIFQITPAGAVSEYKTGYTTLIHLALTANNKPIALQFATFDMGFQPQTGKVVNENGTVLLDNLTMPTDIKRSGDKSFYLLSYALGTIQKLSY